MGKVDHEYNPQAEASKMLEAALQQMDGIIHGVKLDNGEIPATASSTKVVLELAEALSKAITDAAFPSTLPSPNVALLINKWINQNSKNKETLQEAKKLDKPSPVQGTPSASNAKRTRKGADDSNSSPEETLKPTWSGSGSPAAVSSASDFSSSDEEGRKRNSMTKDCNEDFQWLQPQTTKPKVEPLPQQESNPFYSMERNRRMLEPPVQMRLPPQGPGSLDRKRVKTRAERDHKARSTLLPRRKSPAPEELQEHWDPWCGPPCGGYVPCQHYRARPPCSCRSYYGSCESIQSHQSHQSQRNLMRICEVYDDCRRLHGSSEWLCHQQQQLQQLHQPQPHHMDREHSQSWRWLGKSGPDTEERIVRLESDKDSLQLQVTVLTEQVEAQSEKISDLQHTLEDKKHQLKSAEDLLQREMLSRSSLETQKLELMSAISELRLQHAALERENYELKEEKKRALVKPPMMPRNTSPALLQSTNRNQRSVNPFSSHDPYLMDSNPFTSTPTNTAASIGPGSPSPVNSALHRRDDLRNLSLSPGSNFRRSMDQYNSLPRQRILDAFDPDQSLEALQAEAHRKAVAFGKTKSSIITLRSEKSYSAPNLAETERLSLRSNCQDRPSDSEIELSTPVELTPPNSKKVIKMIFSKIRRSNSGNVNDLLGDGDFRRGGVRATAGARLGGPIVRIHIPPDKPFAEWDCELVCDWLEDLGLENYAADMRRWGKTGAQLLAASTHEFEKELSMKNPLHRKKLGLALQEVQGCNDDLLRPAGQLDTHWVLRWLDDVGLPQHKEVFLTGRIDGRMLHRLTMDDLGTLHISSLLHVASIKRGIKVLRQHKMDPNCLTRRSVPGESSPTAAEVALWTNHRVMEWLRVVDLAEYAPNLRGSGVHGGLMVYEPKFTAELLASLLSIPPSKTLLRRHLNTHFKELLGKEVIHGKREAEATLGYVPLTSTGKVKIVKKTQFTLKRKKSRSELEYGDLVCPLTEVTSGSLEPQADHVTTLTACSMTRMTGPAHADCMMRETRRVPDVCPVTDNTPRGSPLSDRMGRM